MTNIGQIPWIELSTFSEVMAVGTAASILPIKSLTRKSTSDKFVYGDEPGECTIKIGSILKGIMGGTGEDQFNWLSRVVEDDMMLEDKGVAVVEDPLNPVKADAFV